MVVTSRYSEAKGGLKLKCIDFFFIYFFGGGGGGRDKKKQKNSDIHGRKQRLTQVIPCRPVALAATVNLLAKSRRVQRSIIIHCCCCGEPPPQVTNRWVQGVDDACESCALRGLSSCYRPLSTKATEELGMRGDVYSNL